MLITGKIPFFCGQKSSSMRILSLVALFVLTFIYFGIHTTKFGDTYFIKKCFHKTKKSYAFYKLKCSWEDEMFLFLKIILEK